MASLDHEHFGHLRFREDEGWVGKIHLPRFAECRDAEFDKSIQAAENATTGESAYRLRERTRHARRRQELAEGRFQLVIDDTEREGPTESQRQAFDSLIEHETQVLDGILQWLLKIYSHRGYWTLDGLVCNDFGPAVETLNDLKECLRLESVSIHQDETGTIAPITFRFSSSLDEEHGIEVTAVGTEVEDPDGGAGEVGPFGGHKLLAYPFDLPEAIDASAIESSEDGHRFVELQYGGRWSGVFVLDPSMQCVGTVVNTFPRPLSDPKDIRDVRALTPLRRWRTSLRVQKTALSFVGLANWLITLPCLVIAWIYEPRLFWACLALGLAAHAAYYLFDRWGNHLFGLATGHIVLSIVGLVYASRAHNFGSEEHAAAVTSVFGLILWWGTCAITVIAAIVLAATIVTLKRDFLSDGLGAFMFVGPEVICVAALVLGLVVTSYGNWSTLHLLWVTPVSLAGSFVVFFIMMIFEPTSEPKETPCPHCAKPLASPAAKQCLHCGADWHRSSTDA